MSSGAQTLSGVISGTGTFVEDGPGKLTISGGANPFTGSWVLNTTNGAAGSVLSIGADTNLGAWPVTPTTNIFLNGGDLLITGAQCHIVRQPRHRHRADQWHCRRHG